MKYLQGSCFWIASAGVKSDDGEYPEKSVFENIFKNFYIPEMKLPLRLTKQFLLIICVLDNVHISEMVEILSSKSQEVKIRSSVKL